MKKLTIQDGLVLKNNCMVIPSSKHDYILKQIHCGHLGIQKCQLRAKETVYWPRISKDIENMVSNCETSLKFSVNNRWPKPDNQLGYEVPIIHWVKDATGIFTFNNCNYFLMVDYTSKFPMFCKLPWMTTGVVTEMIKSIFSEYDKPSMIIVPATPLNTLQKRGPNRESTTLPHHLTITKAMG